MTLDERLRITTATIQFIASVIQTILLWLAIYRTSTFFAEWTLNDAAGDFAFWAMIYTYFLSMLICGSRNSGKI